MGSSWGAALIRTAPELTLSPTQQRAEPLLSYSPQVFVMLRTTVSVRAEQFVQLCRSAGKQMRHAGVAGCVEWAHTASTQPKVLLLTNGCLCANANMKKALKGNSNTCFPPHTRLAFLYSKCYRPAPAPCAAAATPRCSRGGQCSLRGLCTGGWIQLRACSHACMEIKNRVMDSACGALN